MYKPKRVGKSYIGTVEPVEGETIEHKVERILNNKEPITDGAPEIYTERKDGVGAEYNIRTDRWELATESMDIVNKQKQAKRDAKAKVSEEKKDTKVIKLKSEGSENVNGTSD